MCMSSPIQKIANSKPAANVVNYTGLGLLYPSLSGDQKLSDGIKSGNLFAGYAGGAAINQMNKKQAKLDKSGLNAVAPM